MVHMRSTRIVHSLAVIAGIGILLGMAPASAQSADVDPLEGLRTEDSPSDPFAGNGDGQTRGAMQLFHQLQLNNGVTMDEFSNQQQDAIQSAAEQFRQQRMERLRQTEGTTPAGTAPANSSNSADTQTVE